ncbi:MAG: hypothetical protein WDN66_04325 [Candidatus Saccharibacteria bacterium]
MVYNLVELNTAFEDKPSIDIWKLYKDDHGVQWITPEGTTRLLSKRFPTIQAEDVMAAVARLEADSGQSFTKDVVRVPIAFTGTGSLTSNKWE